MGCMQSKAQSKNPPAPIERLPYVRWKFPSPFQSMNPQYKLVKDPGDLQEFFSLKTRISESKSRTRGDMGLLAAAFSLYQNEKETKEPDPPRPLSSFEIERLEEIIERLTEIGIMFQEGNGLSHWKSLHCVFEVGKAYCLFGEDDKAQPLLEQVFILGEDKPGPEFTKQIIETAECLNVIYLKKELLIEKSMKALEKKAFTPSR